MLKRRKRIQRHEFGRVLKAGETFRSRYFTLRALKDKDTLSFSVVVSKKTMHGAVGRNRLRRRVYHILEKLIPDLKTEYSLALFARKGANERETRDLEDEIRTLFLRANVLKSSH